MAYFKQIPNTLDYCLKSFLISFFILVAVFTFFVPQSFPAKKKSEFDVVTFDEQVKFIAKGSNVQEIKIEIYDLEGRLVYKSGKSGQEIKWDGVTGTGKQITHGTFLYRIKAFKGGQSYSSGLGKIVVLPTGISAQRPPKSEGGASDTIPAKPTDLKIRSNPESFTIEWHDNSNNEQGFKIYRDGVRIDTVGANRTSYSDPGVTAEKQYCYAISAYNERGESDKTSQRCGSIEGEKNSSREEPRSAPNQAHPTLKKPERTSTSKHTKMVSKSKKKLSESYEAFLEKNEGKKIVAILRTSIAASQFISTSSLTQNQQAFEQLNSWRPSLHQNYMKAEIESQRLLSLLDNKDLQEVKPVVSKRIQELRESTSGYRTLIIHRHFNTFSKAKIEDFLRQFRGELKFVYSDRSFAARVPLKFVPDIARTSWVTKVVDGEVEHTSRERLELDESTALINADRTRNSSDGSAATVAILESGFDDGGANFDWGIFDHLGDLYKKDYTDGDSDNDGWEEVGNSDHGTHVGGIINAEDNFKGVAPEVGQLILLKVENNFQTKAALDDVSDGLDGDGIPKANVVNMSFGYDVGYSDASYGVSQKVDGVASQGLVCVTAGAQGGTQADQEWPPADAKNSITVGNVDYQDSKQSYDGPVDSDDSGNDNTRIKPDVVAPGMFIYSTTTSGWGMMSGTSMATPHVTGAAALLVDAFKGTDIWNNALEDTKTALIKAGLMANSTDLGSTGRENTFGAGEVDTEQAVYSAYFGGSVGTDESQYFTTENVDQGDKVRIVLTWADMINDNWGIRDHNDLDLYVDTPSGSYAASSADLGDTVESVTFTASESGNYEVEVNGYDVGGSQNYGGAWAVYSEPNAGVDISSNKSSVTPGEHLTITATGKNEGGYSLSSAYLTLNGSGYEIVDTKHQSVLNQRAVLGNVSSWDNRSTWWELKAKSGSNQVDLEVTIQSGNSSKDSDSLSIPVEEPPQLCIYPDPANHDFGKMSRGDTSSWSFTVENCGGQTLNWSASDNKGWISLSPTSGSLSGGNSEQVTVTVDTSGLSYGSHTGDLDINNGTTKDGDISLYVNEPPNQPYDPSPSNGANNVDMGFDVCWQGSDPDGDSLKYDVWFEKNDSTPDDKVCSNNTSGCCNVSLDSGSQYYWKVRAEDGIDSTTSPTWEFETEAAQSDITIATDPSGKTIKVDGTSHTSPYTFNCTSGNNHDLTAPSPQAGSSGTRYVYDHWSDGGGQTHTISCPSSDKTYTAYFNTQYELTTSTDPSGGGNISRDPSKDWYNNGESVQLTANPSSGYKFDNWSGDLSGSTNPDNLLVNSPKSVTAHFPKEDSTTLPVGWNIFSPPGEPINPDPGKSLGDDIDSLQLYYDYSNGNYTNYPDTSTRLIWKQGYWVQVGGDTLVDMGVDVPTQDHTLEFTEEGWNMIGVPYAVDWSQANFSDPTHFQTDGAGNVRVVAWSPEEELYYNHYSDQQYVLGPWSGYWVKVKSSPASLTITKSSSTPDSLNQRTPLPQSVDKSELDYPPLPQKIADSFQAFAYPNPVVEENKVTFAAQMPSIEKIKVTVSNTTGEIVYDSGYKTGQKLIWNLNDTSGNKVANGIYLYKIQTIKADGTTQASEVKRLLVL